MGVCGTGEGPELLGREGAGRGLPPRCRADGRARQRGGPEPTGECPGPWLRTSCQPEIPWLPLLPTSPSERQQPRSNSSISSPFSPLASPAWAPCPPVRGRRRRTGASPCLRGPSRTRSPWWSRPQAWSPRPARSQRACLTLTGLTSESQARALTRRASSSRPQWRRPWHPSATTARSFPSTSWLRASSPTLNWRPCAGRAPRTPSTCPERAESRGRARGSSSVTRLGWGQG